MRLSFVFVAALCVISTTHSSIIGIDLGSDFVKLTAPKYNDVDIVLNQQSNRKTANFIGFRGNERYFGDDAKALAPRFPDNMMTMVGRLVGVPHNASTSAWLHALFRFTTKIEQNTAVVNATSSSTATLSLRTGSNPDVAYTAEALQAMIFSSVRRTVKQDTGKLMRNAVVTVPAAFTRRQRQAMIDAGTLGGLRVVGTVHSTSMAALQYGMQNRINDTHTVLIIDVGATKTDIGVYSFSAPTKAKGGKKTKNAEAMGVVTTEALVSDLTLGGRAFDSCVAEIIEDRFVKQLNLPRLTGKTIAERKAIISLMRAANKAKEVLSVNKAANVNVEGVAPGKDFATKITRREFELKCDPLFRSVVALTKTALEKAGPNITSDTLDAFEIIGGGTRIPLLLDGLRTLWGGKAIGRTLNGDEAAAMGAAYYGGAVTGRFRMKFYGLVEDMDPVNPDTNVTFALTPKPSEDTDAENVAVSQLKSRSLFVRPKIGAKKTITVNRTEAFGIHLFITVPGSDVPVHDRTITVTNIAAQLNSVSYFNSIEGLATSSGSASLGLRHPNNTHTVRIKLIITESGLVAVDEASVYVVYARNMTRRVKVNRTDAEFEEAKATAVAKAEEKEEKWEAERIASEEEAAALANATVNATDANTTVTGGEKAAEEEPGSDKPDASEDNEETNEETKEAKEQATDDAKKVGDNGTNATKSNVTKLSPEERRANARASRISLAGSLVKKWRFINADSEEMWTRTLELRTATDYTFPQPMTAEDYKSFSATILSLDTTDDNRRRLSKARNDLETYIMWVKMEGVLENPEVKALGLMTAEVEELVVATAKNQSDWLEEEAGDETAVEEYKAHFKELRDVVRPIRKALKVATKLGEEKEEKKSGKKSKKGGKKKADKKKKKKSGSKRSDTNQDAADGSSGTDEDNLRETTEGQEDKTTKHEESPNTEEEKVAESQEGTDEV